MSFSFLLRFIHFVFSWIKSRLIASLFFSPFSVLQINYEDLVSISDFVYISWTSAAFCFNFDVVKWCRLNEMENAHRNQKKEKKKQEFRFSMDSYPDIVYAYRICIRINLICCVLCCCRRGAAAAIRLLFFSLSFIYFIIRFISELVVVSHLIEIVNFVFSKERIYW